MKLDTGACGVYSIAPTPFLEDGAIDWTSVGPAVIVMVGALVALLVDAFYSRRTWLGSELPSALALTGAGILVFTGDMAPYPFAFSLLVLSGALFVVIASRLPSCWPTGVTPSIFTGPAPTVSALSFQ